MKKTKPMKSYNHGEDFLQEYLKRNALELYEWHLKLCYLSTSDRLRHNIIRHVSGIPDDVDFPVSLCSECHNKLLTSGDYELETVVHNPDIHPFPHNYDDFLRSSIETLYDVQFKKCAQEIIEEMKNDGENIYFPDDPEKEYALVYLDGVLGGRGESPIDNFCFFKVLSHEAKCLAIVYLNFREYQPFYDFHEDELIALIDKWRDCIIGDSREMIGYWRLGDKLKRWGRTGGAISKKPLGIIQAIKSLIQTTIIDAGLTINNFKAAELSRVLWDHFKSHELSIDGYQIFFDHDAEKLVQAKSDDRKTLLAEIAFERFKKHVSSILKEMK